DPAIQAECIHVFAMGGASKHDDAADSAYYTLRTALTEIAKETGRALAASAVSQSAGGLNLTPGQAAAWLASIIEAVAKRFGIKITEKVAAQAAPVIGAVSGAAINTLFINHYQDMARGHFTVKRLEMKYGEDAVRAAYEQVRNRY